MAAQDFRHTRQEDGESVATFIRRLERTFQIAYGHDRMSTETRDTLLHGQLQEGLQHEIMRAPAVSGAQTYRELCVAARNEEKRLDELRKRKQYQGPVKDHLRSRNTDKYSGPKEKRKYPVESIGPAPQEARKCFVCHRAGHLARDCSKRTESRGWKGEPRSKQVTTEPSADAETNQSNILPLLFSSDDESDGGVGMVCVPDHGSRPRSAQVNIQGVPACGVVDSGSDLTIMGSDLLRKVAAVARLKKKDLKPPDKKPRNYDARPFKLHGRMDLTISFDGRMLTTPVYIKMDAEEPLLLSEGVCRQLGIIQYHPDVEVHSLKERRKAVYAATAEKTDRSSSTPKEDAVVPMVSVRLVHCLRLPAGYSAVVPVTADGAPPDRLKMLEPYPSLHDELGLEIADGVLQFTNMGEAHVVITNNSGFTQRVDSGKHLGQVVDAVVVDGGDASTLGDESLAVVSSPLDDGLCAVVRVDEIDNERKRKLLEMMEMTGICDREEGARLKDFLVEHHEAFSIDPGERGESDLVRMEVDTGDATPRRQPVRRLPFALRQEVARQLKDMQQSGVIQPSSSPWASPVVMVRKKDGSHRFCVDYRLLNAVTKPDLYPLPRIDDLLDQLGKSQYFSTLDLASGYWQIRVHPNSIEKTAFITPQGLFEFRVMPFGLKNAPSVFQRLMSRVLMGLNPEDGPDFVAVYIDDVLIFSRTLTDHIQHLKLVITRIQEVGLKLKPTKCHFVRREVEYLGHIITPDGLMPTPKLTKSVMEFPVPRNVREVRQFLGLSSYYRRFIPQFAHIARPLHVLTRKDVQFVWTEQCQSAFATLKGKLTQAPVLSYPCFNKPFVLETDASGVGIGAVLSQLQDDVQLHPIAYASRALSPAESKYAVTELETLAVVWALSHFHPFLYGHSVTVYTDHSAVKAVLNTPNPSGKHARWWTRVYGKGVNITFQYRPGKANANADALSRCPQAPAPDAELVGDEIQVAAIGSDDCSVGDRNIDTLLKCDPISGTSASFEEDQRKDPAMVEIIRFLEEGVLPDDPDRARKLALQEHLFVIIDRVLYRLDSKQDHRKQVVVPRHLQEQIMEEAHRGPMSGHFSGQRLFNTLRRHWWWGGMFGDAQRFVKGCPECAVTSGGGRVLRPPLHPIPVTRPFQILGVDVMDLPKTLQGNKHVLVFQDLFTKWPMVYAMPDQKAERIVRILVDEIIPFCGVPEALLSDRGTNLLSYLMRDVCALLGVKKLNTTAYHPQCDGLVERYNRTLKTALRKHAARYGVQWDRLLSGVVWAYRNTPHESTHEKPSYLLFGLDCRSPTEASLLCPTEVEPTDLVEYREELTMSLASARELAAKAIRQAQKKYKRNYDKRTGDRDYRIGEWVLVRFPADETGKMRKLARPWHGPFRVMEQNDTNVTVTKVYRPQDGQIQVHKTRVTPCPDTFPAGYHWYGDRRASPGRPPRWIDRLLEDSLQTAESEPNTVGEAVSNDGLLGQHPSTTPTMREDEEPASGAGPVHEPNTPSPSARTFEPDLEVAGRQQQRYGLRQRVAPPDRLLGASSGRAKNKRGG